MVIKRAESSEAADLAKLAVKMWDSTVSELTASFADSVNSENTVFFIAYQDNLTVGFAQCQLRHDYVEGTETSPVGYLEGIFVREEFRCLGIASRLLNECQNWAKAKGCTEFASDCEINNDDSLKFHLKTGFAEANRIICFSKKL